MHSRPPGSKTRSENFIEFGDGVCRPLLQFSISCVGGNAPLLSDHYATGATTFKSLPFQFVTKLRFDHWL